jgi:hypothetical protein
VALVPEVPPSDEVVAEEQARTECACPGCIVREAVDAAIEGWPAADRIRFMRVLVAEAERLGRSLTENQ